VGDGVVPQHKQELPRENFLNCKGNSGRYYVRFFLREDYELLVSAVKDDQDFKGSMGNRYTLFEQHDGYAAGYFYHDDDDPHMAKDYPIVDLRDVFLVAIGCHEREIQSLSLTQEHVGVDDV
jgi:hypothetical protein